MKEFSIIEKLSEQQYGVARRVDPDPQLKQAWQGGKRNIGWRSAYVHDC